MSVSFWKVLLHPTGSYRNLIKIVQNLETLSVTVLFLTAWYRDNRGTSHTIIWRKLYRVLAGSYGTRSAVVVDFIGSYFFVVNLDGAVY